MLELPDVTLVLVETREHDLGQMALEECERHCRFGDVVVFTDRPSQFMTRGRRIVTVDDWPTKLGWSQCFWYDVPQHVYTSHSLGIQWDSWVVRPDLWKPEFLDYDYIGAPWWYTDGLNVGNGGFCIRSTALLRYIYKNRARFPCITDLDDDLYSRKYRIYLEALGFRWAPEIIAKDFAFECVRYPADHETFGFHAAFNFDYGCGDEARLLERARVMWRSEYIRNGRIGKSFAEKFPQIVTQLSMKENAHG